MRKLILICMMLFIGCATTVKDVSQVPKPTKDKWVETKEITWRVDEIAAEAEAEYNDKIIMIYFYPKFQCKPCDDMSSKTFTDKEVISKVNEDFVAVKLLATDEVIKKYHITSVPVVRFFNSDGSPLGNIHSYRSPDKFLKVLNRVIQLKEGK